MDLEKRLAVNRHDYQIRNIVNALYHNVLQNYIADANRRDVLESLYRFYTETDVTLISKAQLHIYQELEKYTLEIDARKVNKNG